MAILSRDQIQRAEDQQTRTVPVPEWGGDVLVRGMSGKERDAFEDATLQQRGKGRNMTREANMRNFRARLVVETVVDEAGRRLFNKSDLEWLGDKSAAALQRVFNAATELSGMRDEDVDELMGNSPDDPNDASTSG